ncbi:hypothetical protein MNBD_CHLOROFLEXI01-2867 [hydrothermal vent metagenome]|uniref:Thioredoxin domain-containing protein n=1 Tax=hydrothermal vent metagenome TaxID=652676 RepID=A0A3B0W0G2_9ZZZZ
MGIKKIVGGTAVFLLLFLVLVGCAAPEAEESDSGGVQIIASGTIEPPTRGAIVVDLPDMGEAPEWRNDVWINSDGPITLASQRGKVVLLEFWTFG